MKVTKVVRAQGEFAKINEDIKDGDLIKILSEGQIITGDYGDRHVFKVETRNGEKNLSFNQSSMNNLIEAYGDDTVLWIGKNAKSYVVKQNVGGSLKNVCYLVGEGWTMLDDGRITKDYDASKGEDPRPEDVAF